MRFNKNQMGVPLDDRLGNLLGNSVFWLIDGALPERKDDVLSMWEKLGPVFHLLDDSLGTAAGQMSAGAYRYVHFDHRFLRLFWVAAFVAWEAYVVYYEISTNIVSGGEVRRVGRLLSLIDSYHGIAAAADSSVTSLPDGIPEPGVYCDDPELRAPAELATIAVAWAFLHELRHLQYQQEEDKEYVGPAVLLPDWREELSCDAFATKFLTDGVSNHSLAADGGEKSLLCKRRLGIYFALFAMVLMSRDDWGGSATHPPLQLRINETLSLLGSDQDDQDFIVASAAFSMLQQCMPGAPGLNMKSTRGANN